MITLITEPEGYSPQAVRTYRTLGAVYFLPSLARKRKKAIVQGAHVLVTGLNHHIDRRWIDTMPELKVVATNTTGLNHVDVDYLKQKRIKLISLRGRTGFLKYVPSTAEATMGLVLALVRNIPWSFDHVRQGKWDRDAWRGHQLLGKTMGIVGLGRLGKMVARYARAFGMSVVASDPYVSARAMARVGVRKMPMERLFKTADVVSLHALLTDETHGLVRARYLKFMKPTSYLVNTARAELIEKGALHNALREKWIAGVATDVLHDERPDGSHLKDEPLIAYAKANMNLLIVPHVGGATYEAMAVTQEFLAGLVARHFRRAS